MALFKRTKEKVDSSAEKAAGRSVKQSPAAGDDTASRGGKSPVSVLFRARITEKATMLSERNVYTFEVHPRANRKEIAQAIRETYGVVPLSVRIVSLPAKRIFSRGVAGRKPGVKKALVALKRGETIEVV